MSSLGQHFSQIKLKKRKKNKSYKAFSRYQTDLSLVGLNSLPYMFFLGPPAERCFPSLSWIPLLSFQHLPLLLQLSHGLLAVFQQIKLLKNNSSCKKTFSYRSFSQLTILYHTHQCNIMGNFAFLKFNPCCSVYPRTAARQIRSYGSSAENPSALAIGAQYLNVSPIIETLVFALEEAAAVTGRNFLPTRHSPQKIRCSGAFLQLHRSWQESHSGCHLRNPLLLGIRKALPIWNGWMNRFTIWGSISPQKPPIKNFYRPTIRRFTVLSIKMKSPNMRKPLNS